MKFTSPIKIIFRAFKREIWSAYLFLWRRKNSKYGNIHMGLESAKCIKIPKRTTKVYVRQTTSDMARIFEYLSGIYFRDSYLHEKLKSEKPTVLIDLGANIGLSSLALAEEFQSIKNVIAIEAEEKNFEILKSNFELWGGKWTPVNAIVSSDNALQMKSTKSLAELTGKNSASGTFRFIEGDAGGSDSSVAKVIALSDLFEQISPQEKVIVKIDIEGSEEILFKRNTQWIERCLFIACELHDRFDPVMLYSSKNMINALAASDFAFVASNDVLYCYNRALLFTENTL